MIRVTMKVYNHNNRRNVINLGQLLVFTLLALFIYTNIIYSQTSSVVYEAGTIIEVGAGADICAANVTILGTYSGSGTQCNAPLPVELIAFSAEVNNGRVTLQWQTATEVNNYGFEIERAEQNENRLQTEWITIGFAPGSGNSNSVKYYSFVDNSIELGRFLYRLKQIDNDGGYDYSDVISVELSDPEQFALAQNFPNPFNPKTVIRYSMKEAGEVSIVIYDMAGNQTAVLVNEIKPAGSYIVEFDASTLASGVYTYTMTAGNFRDTKKLILMK